MNERVLSPQLLKLVQAAGPGYSQADPEWVKKFAELIIKECLLYTSPSPHEGTEMGRTLAWVDKNIKQHFGVE